MPELPDLTLYARNLRKLVCDKPIKSADIFNAAKVGARQDVFHQSLVGSAIQDIDRNGKELFFSLTNGQSFSVHLMLFGKFTYMPWLDAHRVNAKIVSIGFEDGNALIISDFKGMCRVALNPPKPVVPDAMSKVFSWDYFAQTAARKATMNIKAFLIDQKVVRGIGNAYVDEILWKANVSPKSITGRIPEDSLRAIYDAIHWCMEDAIANLERLCPDCISGEERSFLRVHQPSKQITPDGDPILCENVAQKRTYFTAKQKLYV